ncbi:hypothetical protein C5E45_00525 [Nocardia nova]|uniref:Uncharacterized protein n=1 Tax=Nocardia nova TaxID=37330 RepID=A0A2S6AWQ8_9NOCA|nr:hypothetical protein [Nocardia nova]PPJ28366.1 hypothetical protein C5E41_13745 [Nocardia nova]PPJ39685.1 hypothetical protein C5E45_00525 [Nocardia nova]
MDETLSDETSIDVEVRIPEGFIPLPLRDIDAPVAQVEDLFASAPPGEISAVAPKVLQALRIFLNGLGSLGAVYCGLGKHHAADGSDVTSTLVISSVRYGEPKNPRLTLVDYLVTRGRADEYLHSEVVDYAGKNFLLSDRVLRLPTPEWHGPEQDIEDDARVYQIEAVVPSRDGAVIAVAELSTPFVDKGEEFVPMMLAIAYSLEVRGSVPAFSPSSLNM